MIIADKPINFLIVDDSMGVRRIIQRQLMQTGLPVGDLWEASDGKQALEILGEKPVSFVLTDINMPNMDGIEFLRSMRSLDQWKNVPVVMVTTEGSEQRVREAASLGANGYLRKPFSQDQVREKVISVLNAAKRHPLTARDITTEDIADMLFSGVREVFNSMMGTEVEKVDMIQDWNLTVPFDGVFAVVGLTGSCVGTGSMACIAPVACDLASRFLATEVKDVDDSVLDSVGELTNMIFGGAKNSLDERLGPVRMSIPASVQGKDIVICSPKGDITVPVRCTYAGGGFLVTLSLATK